MGQQLPDLLFRHKAALIGCPDPLVYGRESGLVFIVQYRVGGAGIHSIQQCHTLQG